MFTLVCFELTELLDQHTSPEDSLYSVGDLINRGPDPHGVLDLIRARNIHAVVGNHEDALLKWRSGWRSRIKDYEDTTISKLQPVDWDLLDSFPAWLELPGGQRLVHAGVLPGTPIEQTDRDLLMRIRCFDATGKARYRSVPGSQPWAHRYTPQHGPFVIFGHSARANVRRYPNAICIDTGCVYGGSLSAYIVEEDRVVRVRSKRVWYDPVKPGRSGRSNTHAAL